MFSINYIPVYQDSFLGIKVEKEKVDFFFPFELSPLIINNKTFALNFLNLLSDKKYSLANSGNNSYNSKDLFYSLQWIIKDFIVNGQIKSISKQIVKNHKGSIDWKKTTLNSKKIITNDGLIFFDIYSQKKSQFEDEIFLIYQHCLSFAANAIGWLFGFKFKFEKNINIKKSISIINKELSKSFRDAHRLKLLNLLIILKQFNDSLNYSDNFIYGIDNFFGIYEQILKHLFTSNLKPIDLQLYYPKGFWSIGNQIIESSFLRPDFLIENDNEIFIFDAKFYRKNNINGKLMINQLPSTTDIQKQIIYGDYIMSKFQKKVYNAFILPTVSKNLLNLMGIAYIDSINFEAHHTIVGLEIDLQKMLGSYFNNEKIDFSSVFEMIIKNSTH